MTVIPLFRRTKRQVIDLETHRARLATIQRVSRDVGAAHERARCAEWLISRARAARLDAEHATRDNEGLPAASVAANKERARMYLLVACELEDAERDMEAGQ